MPKDKGKTVILTVRVTEQENKAIRKAAKDAGVNLSAFTRRRLTEGLA